MRKEKTRGQSLVEYMLILTLISLAVVSSVTLLGKSEEKVFRDAGEAMATAVEKSQDEELAAKNERSVRKHSQQVAQGQKKDVSNSGSSSGSWTSSEAPAGNGPPTAKFSVEPAERLTSNDTVRFLNLSTDPEDDEIVKEEWENKAQSYPAGKHKVRLRVADSHGNWSSWFEEEFEVGNGAPVVRDILMTPNSKVILPDAKMTFKPVAVDPDNDLITYEWLNKKESYPLGQHTVVVTAIDSKGLKSKPYSLSFTVSTVEPGKYSSCRELLRDYPYAKSGTYPIKLADGKTHQTLCDMETSGGGWTQIKGYDYDLDSKPPEGSGLVAKGGFKGNYDVAAPNAWYPDFTASSRGNEQMETFFVNTDGETYSEVRIDYRVVIIWSVDGWSHTHGGGTPNNRSLEGQYVDGISITTGKPGSRNHLYTITSNSSLTTTDPRYAFVQKDYRAGTGTLTGTIDRKLAAPTNSPIEVRIMLDQSGVDENIGIQKFVTWVR